jgi:UbiD family decarboxylase
LVFVPGTFGSSLVVSTTAAERTRVRSLVYHLLSLDRVKKVTVVADDVDPEDLGQVEWSVATRFQADADAIVVTDVVGHPIDPSVYPGKRTSRLGLDATGYGHGSEGRVGHPADALALAREALARTGMLRH